MRDNANTVNIKAPKSGYHHGDLRTAVIESGLEHLKTQPVDKISLRELARLNGVSATSIYRHFPDKESLLAALADKGMEQLSAAQMSVMKKPGAKSFAEIGRVYVRFALANPALFKLMFEPAPVGVNPLMETRQGSSGSLLRQAAQTVAPSTATPETQYRLIMRAWSLVHGLAMLLLSGQVPEDQIDDLIETVISTENLILG